MQNRYSKSEDTPTDTVTLNKLVLRVDALEKSSKDVQREIHYLQECMKSISTKLPVDCTESKREHRRTKSSIRSKSPDYRGKHHETSQSGEQPRSNDNQTKTGRRTCPEAVNHSYGKQTNPNVFKSSKASSRTNYSHCKAADEYKDREHAKFGDRSLGRSSSKPSFSTTDKGVEPHSSRRKYEIESSGYKRRKNENQKNSIVEENQLTALKFSPRKYRATERRNPEVSVSEHNNRRSEHCDSNANSRGHDRVDDTTVRRCDSANKPKYCTERGQQQNCITYSSEKYYRITDRPSVFHERGRSDDDFKGTHYSDPHRQREHVMDSNDRGNPSLVRKEDLLVTRSSSQSPRISKKSLDLSADTANMNKDNSEHSEEMIQNDTTEEESQKNTLCSGTTVNWTPDAIDDLSPIKYLKEFLELKMISPIPPTPKKDWSKRTSVQIRSRRSLLSNFSSEDEKIESSYDVQVKSAPSVNIANTPSDEDCPVQSGSSGDEVQIQIVTKPDDAEHGVFERRGR